MYIPDKFKILGAEYEVFITDNMIRDTSTNHLIGQTSYMNQHIYVDARFTKQIQEVTFLHELIHAIVNIMNIEEVRNSDAEETIVDNITNGLYGYLKQNNLDIVQNDNL